MERLRTFWLFADLAADELASLAGVAVSAAVPDGATLFRQGDPTPGLHLVEVGAIKIYTLTPDGEERIVDLIGPGEFCGEMGVVDSAPAGAWGEAIGATQVRIIPAQAFERLLLANPRLGLKLCRALVAKLRSAGRQLDETIFLGARDRVVRQLVHLAQRHGRPSPEGTLVPLRLTHAELGRMVGTARETVSRVLSDLQQRGLLTIAGRQLVIHDLEALREWGAQAVR